MVRGMVASHTDGKEPIAYAEHDKLGPLGSKSALLHDPKELRKALVREFTEAAEAAGEAAKKAREASGEAVHEVRKALRRARAVLSTIGDALPKSERRAVKAALQQSRRGVSAARDHAVAPETLAALSLDDANRTTATAVIANAKQAVPSDDEIKAMLDEAAKAATAQAAALDAALPPELDWSVVASGVRAVYADARRARRAAKHSKREFHAWRRRSKELAYQLDILKGYAGSRVEVLCSEIEGVGDAQSPAVDLIMVREFVQTYAQGIAQDSVDRLIATIDDQLVDLMKSARRASRDAFDARPAKFERRVSKAVKRDLTVDGSASDGAAQA